MDSMGSENPETQLELGEQDAEPPKRARGRPKGARNKAKETPQKQIEVEDSEEATISGVETESGVATISGVEAPDSGEDAPPMRGKTPTAPPQVLVMKRVSRAKTLSIDTPPKRQARTPTPAPDAGQIADALLKAWESRRGPDRREQQRAMYSSWL